MPISVALRNLTPVGSEGTPAWMSLGDMSMNMWRARESQTHGDGKAFLTRVWTLASEDIINYIFQNECSLISHSNRDPCLDCLADLPVQAYIINTLHFTAAHYSTWLTSWSAFLCHVSTVSSRTITLVRLTAKPFSLRHVPSSGSLWHQKQHVPILIHRYMHICINKIKILKI